MLVTTYRLAAYWAVLQVDAKGNQNRAMAKVRDFAIHGTGLAIVSRTTRLHKSLNG